METVQKNWVPSEAERCQNVERYGQPNPWSCVDTLYVYKVLMCTDEGIEVRLTELHTYVHAHTEEERDWLRPWGDTLFVFYDEWPDNNALQHGPVLYRPHGEVPI